MTEGWEAAEQSWEKGSEDRKLNMSQQCALAVKSANCTLCCISHRIFNQLRKGLFHSMLPWPHLKYFVQFWVPQYKKDIKTIIEHLKENCNNGEECRAKYLWWMAEVTWFGQSREGETERRPHSVLHLLCHRNIVWFWGDHVWIQKSDLWVYSKSRYSVILLFSD